METSLSYGSSFEDMLELLSSGGIDITDFDQRGNKTLKDLYKEVAERDVVLFKDPVSGRIVRHALSVKLIIKTSDAWLLETKRVYANGTEVQMIREWSISETRKRGEDALDCAIRGVYEELGVIVGDPTELKNRLVFDEETEHESKVYPGLLSRVVIRRFEWHMPRRIHEHGTIVRDGDVQIYLRWFSAI